MEGSIASGRTVLDLEKSTRGTYMLKVVSQGRELTYKIIVQ
jgi:hypothetical protein